MTARRGLAATLLSLCLLVSLRTPVQAQLVTVDQDYRVVSIDSAHRCIEVSDISDEKKTSRVLVTSETKLFVLGKALPNFTWKLLRKGMKISVSGGMTWDMKVRAKQIHLL